MPKAAKSKSAEKEKVLSIPAMPMQSFMGKSPAGKSAKRPGLFDKLKKKDKKK